MGENAVSKVALIIPVYNAEKELPKTFQCLMNQTYPELTIVLVDDGSTDRSGTLCDELHINSRYNTIVIHSPNGGVSSARNKGLDAVPAECDYIMFADADDSFPDYFVEAAVLLQEKSPDDIICWTSTEEDFISLEQLSHIKPTSYTFRQMSDYYFTWNICPVWNKIFRADFINCSNDNKLRFLENLRISEDTIFCLNYISRCFQRNPNCNVLLHEAPLYRYIQLSTGLCSTIGINYASQQLQLMPIVIRQFSDFYQLDNEQLACFYHRFVQALCMGIRNITLSDLPHSKKKTLLKDIGNHPAFNELINYYRSNKIYSPYYLPFKFKIYSLCHHLFASQNYTDTQTLYNKLYWLQFYVLKIIGNYRIV